MNYKDLSTPPVDKSTVEDVSNSAEFLSAKRYKAVFLADIPMLDLVTQVPGISSINKVVIIKDKFQITSIVDFFRGKTAGESDVERKIKMMIFCESLRKVTSNDIDIVFLREDDWSASTTKIKDTKYSVSTSLRYFGLGMIGTKAENFRWFKESSSSEMLSQFNGVVTDVGTTMEKIKVEDIFMDSIKYKQYFAENVSLGENEVFFSLKTLQEEGFKDVFLKSISRLDAFWTDVYSKMSQKDSQVLNLTAAPVNFFIAEQSTLELYNIDPLAACNLTLDLRDDKYVLDKTSIGSDLATELDYLLIPRDEFAQEYVIYHEDAVVKTGTEYFNYIKSTENEEKLVTEVYLPECNYPEWDFLEKNILKVTNRADISELLYKSIVNGCIFKNDQTECVVGAGFSFDIYSYLANYFAGNGINSDTLESDLNIKLNGKLSKMMDGNPFSPQSTRDIKITQKAGYYEIFIKVYDPDQERDYQYTLVLS